MRVGPSGGAAATAAFAVGAGVTAAATPLAIRAADRWGFLDRPGGHKRHAAPTPYLGGTAVLVGATVAGACTTAAASDSAPLTVTFAGTAAMWVLGTLDDRSAVAWQLRLGTAAAAGLALSAAGGGFHVCGTRALDALLTCAWTGGLTIALNLMDNLDGACATVAGASALGISATALVNHEPTVAALAAGLSGACLTFLRANLALPRARIFLGDGGSMPIGLLLAALAAEATAAGSAGASPVLAAALLCGLPILDTTLVSIARPRRGVSVLTGGQDHLSHRILHLTGTPRRTASILGAAQALSCSAAVAGEIGGRRVLAAVAAAGVLAGAAVIGALEAFVPASSAA